MNRLLDNGQLREIDCESNFAYVLENNNLFLPTEYKVLQSQSDGSFVKCMKMHYNGHVQLFYLAEGLKSLSSMIPGMDADSFLVVVDRLFADIMDVQSNGFLSCKNVELAFDKIFIDPNTLKVSLIYLPLSEHLFEDYASYESQLRSNLVKLINASPNLSNPKTMRFAFDLSNGMLSLEELREKIKNSGSWEPVVPPKPSYSEMRLVALNAPTPIELKITKTPFTIGMNPAMVDGVLSINKTISRRHCEVSRAGDQYMIADLGSTNGTYINETKLQPKRPYPVKNGDIVRIAFNDFRVIIA